MAILREVGDAVAVGRTLSNLSADYRLLGRYNESLVYCTQALQLLRDAGDTRCVGKTLVNLGEAYEALERTKEAAACFREAMAIFEQLGDIAALALSHRAWEHAMAMQSAKPN